MIPARGLTAPLGEILAPSLWAFVTSLQIVGGGAEFWTVDRIETLAGAPLEPLSERDVVERRTARWREQDVMVTTMGSLGRAASSRAALIVITKSNAWWELPRDERRRIFEDSSHQVATGLRCLPAVARRLHHGRDLGEPFDVLTWFEFGADRAEAFEELVDRLRETQEWDYVEREIDIRLVRARRPRRGGEVAP